MRMTTPAACDESLFRVRYGPDGVVSDDRAAVPESLSNGTASGQKPATASDIDGGDKNKQDL